MDCPQVASPKHDWVRIESPPAEAGFLDDGHHFGGSKGNHFRVTGWARDPVSGAPGREVILLSEHDELIAHTATVEGDRGDVVTALGDDRLARCGWSITLDLSTVAAVEQVILAYVVDPEKGVAYRLRGACVIKGTDPVRGPRFEQATRRRHRPTGRADNFELNRIEIRSGRTELTSLPTWLNVELTQRCNLKCRMCFRYGTNMEGLTIPDAVYASVREDLFPCASNISLNGGGESLVYPQWDEVVHDISRFDCVPQVNTNCTVLDEARIKAMVDAGFELHISLDAATERTYRYIRGASFKKVVRNIEMLRDYQRETENDSFELVIVFTPLVVNLRELPDLVDLAADWGIRRMILQPFFPSPQCFELSPLRAKEFADKMYIEAYRRAIRHGVRFEFPGDQEIERTVREYAATSCAPGTSTAQVDAQVAVAAEASSGPQPPGTQSHQPPPAYCHFPFFQFYIHADGLARPCCGPAPAMGDLLSQEIDEIWNGEDWQSLRRGLLASEPPSYCHECLIRGTLF